MKLLDKLFIFGLVLCFSFNAAAQNEHNIWYFGNGVGIDFNSGTALALNNSAMGTQEGCASVCDNNGDLLFYTDGSVVFNANHFIMPNGIGLLGDFSSTQSAIIVPKPTSTSEYYIFTVDAEADVNGIRYSIVDMNLDGGLGDVTATMNIPMYTPSCEKIAAVQHSNGLDYWIITHEWQSNNYRSHLLNATGVSTTPVISSVGLFTGGVGVAFQSVGYLKASIDGTKIAAAHFGNDTTQVLDFNNSTGLLSNPISLPNTSPYGVEFSPNNNYLYVSSTDAIFQYDLSAGSTANIINSEYNIVSFPVSTMFALQLAPDHRIYCAKIGGTLPVITNPSSGGASCGFNINGLNVNNASGVALGLPTSVNKIAFQPQSFEMTICEGDSIILSPNDFLSHNWALASSPSIIISTSDSLSVSPLVDSDYIVSDGNGIATFSVTVLPSSKIDLGPDLVLCDGDNVILFDINNLANVNPFSTYFWSPMMLSSGNILVDTAGTYVLNLLFGQCVRADTVTVSFIGNSSISILGNDPICFGTPTGSIIVNADTATDLSSLQIFDVNGTQVNTSGTNVANNLVAGTYNLQSSDTSSCGISSIVTLIDPPAIEVIISVQNPLCYGDAAGTATVTNLINFQGDLADVNYVWTPNPENNNGLLTDHIFSLVAGEYTLEVIDDFGCMNSLIFYISDPNPLQANITDSIPTFCRTAGFQSGNGVLAAEVPGATSGTPPINFQWHNLADGQMANTSTVVMRSPGLVELTITDANNCIYKDTIFLDSLNPLADFEIDSEQFAGPLPYEGTELLSIKVTNLSQNYAQAINPNSDTIFQWNLNSNSADGGDWFFTYDVNDKVDTTYEGEAIYNVCLIAKNYNDCADTLCKSVIVHDFPALVTPNVFTPGSAPNSHFFFPAEGIQDFDCTVFNRYGIQVYEFNDITDQWDGSHFKSGNSCSDGVYFYVYSALSTNGTPFLGEGQVTLIRVK